MLDLICRICTGSARIVFSGTVIGDVLADYARCDECESLFVLRPTWLDRAYSSQAYKDYMRAFDRDAAAHEWQGAFAWPIIQQALPQRPCRTLDWGPGNGWLVERLMAAGHEAWGYEKYDWTGPASAHTTGRIVGHLGDAPGQFDLVSAIEVLEHTLRPGVVLEQMAERLTEPGIAVVSTALYDGHGPDWYYLAREYGQHITFPSAKGLHMCAQKAGLRWECTVTGASQNERDYPIHILSRGGFDRARLDGTPWRIAWRS